MARLRQSDRALFPIKNVQSVVDIFRNQLENNDDPDLALLSIIVGYIENNLTSNVRKQAELEIYEPVETTSLPALEADVTEALYAKFHHIIKSSVDMRLYDRKSATRDLVKRVSDVIWNSLTRSYYKERAHLQSLYSYLTGSKLDCFGVALAVVAACQALGRPDIHLALSEDHAWVTFDDGDTAEVTWHGRGCEDRRGSRVPPVDHARSWLYVDGCPVQCSRRTEVAALVSAINPSLNATSDALEVAVVQQRLLWLLYDLGQLARYPMALGNLGDLEEVCPTAGRAAPASLFRQAVRASRAYYRDRHVYPYTYRGGYCYRQRLFPQALSCWAAAAAVISRYDYSREDEEIYKEFLEIATELIPYVMKAGGEAVAGSARAFAHLLRFYDGVCLWEQGSATPVLHTGWAKALVTCMAKFPHRVRTQVRLVNGEDEAEALAEAETERGAGAAESPLNNNNYEEKRGAGRTQRPNIQALTAACSQKILNPEYLLQGGGSPFQTEEAPEEVSCEASTSTWSPEQAGEDSSSSGCEQDSAAPLVTLRSHKMRGLRSLLLAEKLNTQAVSLQLTAQSQVRTKHHGEHALGAKRARRD